MGEAAAAQLVANALGKAAELVGAGVISGIVAWWAISREERRQYQLDLVVNEIWDTLDDLRRAAIRYHSPQTSHGDLFQLHTTLEIGERRVAVLLYMLCDRSSKWRKHYQSRAAKANRDELSDALTGDDAHPSRAPDRSALNRIILALLEIQRDLGHVV